MTKENPGLRFTTLGSGSSGNASWVETPGVKLLIDAGLSARETERRLASIGHSFDEVELVLLSHEHQDHARGLELLTHRHPVAIAASPGTLRAVAQQLDRRCELIELNPQRPRRVADLEITALAIPHDAAEPTGFRLAIGDAVLGHATDFGHFHEALREAFSDATSLVVESNHDLDLLTTGPYPWSLKRRVLSDRGHLSNEDLADFLERTSLPRLRLLCLAHLSRTNNRPALARASAERALGSRSNSITVVIAAHDRAGNLELGHAVVEGRRDSARRPSQLSFAFSNWQADAPPRHRLTSLSHATEPADRLTGKKEEW